MHRESGAHAHKLLHAPVKHWQGLDTTFSALWLNTHMLIHLSHLSHRDFAVRPLLVMPDGRRDLEQAFFVCPQKPSVGIDAYDARAMASPRHVSQCLRKH